MNITTMETERLKFVQLEFENCNDIFRIFKNPDVMRYWIGGPDEHVAETQVRVFDIKKHWMDYGFGDWGIVEKVSNRLIGIGGLHYITDMEEVNLGYALEPSSWRKGYGTELCYAIIAYGLNQLKFSKIVAVIWPENIASVKLVEKCGLRFWKKIIWSGSDRLVYKIENTYK